MFTPHNVEHALNYIMCNLNTNFFFTITKKTDKTYQQIYFDEATIIILNAIHVPKVQHNHSSMEYIFGRRWHLSSRLEALVHVFSIFMGSQIALFFSSGSLACNFTPPQFMEWLHCPAWSISADLCTSVTDSFFLLLVNSFPLGQLFHVLHVLFFSHAKSPFCFSHINIVTVWNTLLLLFLGGISCP